MHLPSLPLWFSLFCLVLAIPNDYPTPTAPTTPSRLFTVAAFVSPYPSGTPGQISGITMRAQGGSFWLNPSNASVTGSPNTACTPQGGAQRNAGAACRKGNETVLWVDRWSLGWLVRSSFAAMVRVSRIRMETG